MDFAFYFKVMKISDAKIQLFDGDNIGAYKAIQRPGSFIGREIDNDIRLSGEGVSRYHAKIELNDKGEWIIRDLGSSNGTKVNAQKIESFQKLESGDLISFGSDKIRFEIIDTGSETKQTSSVKKNESFHGDEKVELYVRTRIKQEMDILVGRLKADKKRRLHIFSTWTFVLVNILLVTAFLLYMSKSHLLKTAMECIVKMLNKALENF